MRPESKVVRGRCTTALRTTRQSKPMMMVASPPLPPQISNKKHQLGTLVEVDGGTPAANQYPEACVISETSRLKAITAKISAACELPRPLTGETQAAQVVESVKVNTAAEGGAAAASAPQAFKADALAFALQGAGAATTQVTGNSGTSSKSVHHTSRDDGHGELQQHVWSRYPSSKARSFAVVEGVCSWSFVTAQEVVSGLETWADLWALAQAQKQLPAATLITALWVKSRQLSGQPTSRKVPTQPHHESMPESVAAPSPATPSVAASYPATPLDTAPSLATRPVAAPSPATPSVPVPSPATFRATTAILDTSSTSSSTSPSHPSAPHHPPRSPPLTPEALRSMHIATGRPPTAAGVSTSSPPAAAPHVPHSDQPSNARRMFQEYSMAEPHMSLRCKEHSLDSNVAFCLEFPQCLSVRHADPLARPHRGENESMFKSSVGHNSEKHLNGHAPDGAGLLSNGASCSMADAGLTTIGQLSAVGMSRSGGIKINGDVGLFNGSGHAIPVEGHSINGDGHSINNDGHSINGNGHSIPVEAHSINGDGHSINGDGHSINGDGHSINSAGHLINGAGYSINRDGHPINGAGYPINGAGYPINGAGHLINGAGHTINGSGYPINRSGYPINGSGYSINRYGYPINGAGYSINGASHQINGTGCPINEPGHVNDNLVESMSSADRTTARHEVSSPSTQGFMAPDRTQRLPPNSTCLPSQAGSIKNGSRLTNIQYKGNGSPTCVGTCGLGADPSVEPTSLMSAAALLSSVANQPVTRTTPDSSSSSSVNYSHDGMGGSCSHYSSGDNGSSNSNTISSSGIPAGGLSCSSSLPSSMPPAPSIPETSPAVQRKSVLRWLLWVTDQAVDALQPMQCAHIVFSLGKMGISHHDLIHKLLDQTASHLPALPSIAATNMCWACAKLGVWPDRQWLQDVCDIQAMRFNDMPPKTVVALVWSAATLAPNTGPHWATAAAVTLTHRLDCLTHSELNNLIWALATLDVKVSMTSPSKPPNPCSPHHINPAGSTPHYINPAGSTPHYINPAGSTPLSAVEAADTSYHLHTSFLPAFFKYSIPQLPRYDPRMLIGTISSLARMRATPPPEWMYAFCEVVLQHLHSLDARQTSLLLWALAKLRRVPPLEWSVQVADRFHVLRPHWQGGDVASMVWSIPSVTHMHTDKFKAACPGLLSDLVASSYPSLPNYSAAQLVQVVDGFAKMRHYPGVRWMDSHERACSRWKFNAQNQTKLRQAYQFIWNL